MKISYLGIALAISMTTLPAIGQAQSQGDIGKKISAMERQLQELKRQLENTQKQIAKNKNNTSMPADRAKVKWHIAGYAHVGYEAGDEYEIGGVADDDTFGTAQFSPILHFKYRDIAQFEAELKFKVKSDGTTDAELEYSNVNLFLHDNLTFVAGQYLSPVGQFQERLHPSWINKFPNAPVGFGHGEVQPSNDLGVQVRGGVPVGGMTFNYVLALGNGPQMSHHGVEMKAFAQDDNDNKAFSGRIGVIPLPHWEIGASFMRADVKGKEGANGFTTTAAYRLYGGDLSFTKGAWDLRAEYMTAKLGSHFGQAEDDEDTSEIVSTRWTAWYVQAAYRLSGLTRQAILKNFEPAIRYGRYSGKGHSGFLEANRSEGIGPLEERISVGLNYYFAPSLVAKGSIDFRDFIDSTQSDDTRYLLQTSYGF